MATITIDPGHGGANFGASYHGRREKDDNLRLALALRDRLTALGQRVVMTRSTDVDVPLSERAAISNRNNSDLFLSIHRNASTDGSANGVETYVHPAAAAGTVDFATRTLDSVVNLGSLRNRGLKKADFQVLRQTTAPAQLLEMGFVSNVADNAAFDADLNANADAIANAILATLGISQAPNKYTLTAQLQAALNAQYGAGLVVDGFFGPLTRAAVRNVRRGDTGTLVRILQSALTMHGYPTVADGIFGAVTDANLRAYQASRGLTVDGIAGQNTFASLLG